MSVMICITSWSCRRSSPVLKIMGYACPPDWDSELVFDDDGDFSVVLEELPVSCRLYGI